MSNGSSGNITHPDFSGVSDRIVRRYNRRVALGMGLALPLAFAALLIITKIRLLGAGETFLGIGNTPDPVSRFIRHHVSDIVYSFGFTGFLNIGCALDDRPARIAKNTVPLGYGKPLFVTAVTLALGITGEFSELQDSKRHFDFVDLASYIAGGLLYTFYHRGMRAFAYRSVQGAIRRELAT